MTTPRWLNEREARAWRGYRRMRTLLDLQLSRDLARTAGLSDADYTVLAVLSETPDYRLRLIDLAERMLWSQSRLAHHLDRMEQRELVCREDHPTNSRATVVALSSQGLRVIQSASRDHVESVRCHFIDLLTEEQIDTLAEATELIVEHLLRLTDEQRVNQPDVAAKEPDESSGRRSATSNGRRTRSP